MPDICLAITINFRQAKIVLIKFEFIVLGEYRTRYKQTQFRFHEPNFTKLALKVIKSQKHFFWNAIAQKTNEIFDKIIS